MIILVLLFGRWMWKGRRCCCCYCRWKGSYFKPLGEVKVDENVTIFLEIETWDYRGLYSTVVRVKKLSMQKMEFEIAKLTKLRIEISFLNSTCYKGLL